MTACSEVISCPTYLDITQRCEEGYWDHCSVQLDDANENGLGSVCDGCDSSVDIGINNNSNAEAEWREFPGRWAQEAQGDACEQVPTQISRPVLQTVISPALGGPVRRFPSSYDGATHTLFASSSTIGVGSSMANQKAGYRWCSCWKEGGTCSTM